MILSLTYKIWALSMCSLALITQLSYLDQTEARRTLTTDRCENPQHPCGWCFSNARNTKEGFSRRELAW